MKKLVAIMLLSYTPYMYTMYHTYNAHNLAHDLNHPTRMKINIEVITSSHNEITFTITQGFLNNNDIAYLKNTLTRLVAKKTLLNAKNKVEEQLENEHTAQLQDRRNQIMQLITQSDNMNTTNELRNLSDQASEHAMFCYQNFNN